MKKGGMYWRAPWLLLVVFLAFTSNVQSQDLFREMDQLKKEVAALKQELSDLRNLVFELRKGMLGYVAEHEEKTPRHNSRSFWVCSLK